MVGLAAMLKRMTEIGLRRLWRARTAGWLLPGHDDLRPAVRALQGIFLIVVLLACKPARLSAQPVETPKFNYSGKALFDLDFTDADLDGISFLNSRLRATAFVGTNLQHADFRGCKIDYSVFSGAKVAYADFTNADLTGAHLTGIVGLASAKLKNTRFQSLLGVNFAYADLRGESFAGVDAYKADFGSTDLSGCDFSRASLIHANFSAAKLRNANLSQVDLRFADLRQADLTGAVLTGSNIGGADLTGCIGLTQAVVQTVLPFSAGTRLPADIDVSDKIIFPPNDKVIRLTQDLSWADLHSVTLQYFELPGRVLRAARLPRSLLGVNLQQADLSYAFAEGSEFSDARLAGASFAGAYLSGADLEAAQGIASAGFQFAHLDEAKLSGIQGGGMNLTGAYLRHTNLSGATLVKAVLRGANLQGANLENADLRGADLSGADLTDAELKGAQLANTNLQDTFGLRRGQLVTVASYDKRDIPKRLRAQEDAPPVALFDDPADEDLPPLFSRQVKLALRRVLILACPAFICLVLLRLISSLAGRRVAPRSSRDTGYIDSTINNVSATSRRRRPWWKSVLVICASIAFMIGGTAIFRADWYRTQQKIATMAHWTAIPCEILASDVTRKNPDDYTYATNFRYSYVIRGRSHVGTRYDLNELPSRDLAAMERIVNRYPVGAITQCLVDPADPDNAVLTRSTGSHATGLLAAGLLIAAGILGIVWTLIRPRPIPGPDAARAEAGAVDDQHPSLPRRIRPGPLLFRAADARLRQFNSALFLTLAGCAAMATSVAVAILFQSGPAVWALATVFLSATAVCSMLLYQRLRTLLSAGLELALAGPLELAVAIDVEWSFSGRARRVQDLTVTLVGTEEVNYTDAGGTETDRRVFERLAVLEVPGAGRRRRGHTVLMLPHSTMHTFLAPHNKITWELRSRVELAGRGSLHDVFPIVIYPNGAAT